MKKVLIYFLCFAIALGIIFSCPVISKADIIAGTITIGKISGSPGDTVLVPINISENPGIMAVTVTITYDNKVLKHTGFDYGDVFSDFTIASHKERSNIRLVICDKRDKFTDGNIISFKFKILDNAPAAFTAINLEYNRGDFCNWDLQKIMPTVIPGGIDVNYNGSNCPHSSYSEWKELSKQSCIDKGVNFRECEKCGHLEYQEIPPLGHTYSEKWTIDTPATTNSNGTMARYCIRCDECVDRVTFSIDDSYKESLNNSYWYELPDNTFPNNLFSTQNPDKPLTKNEPQTDTPQTDSSTGFISGDTIDTDSVLNNVVPNNGVSNSGNINASDKIEEVIPFYDLLFKIIIYSVKAILLIILF